MNGEPTTDFWNGTQAEYIDERTQHTDGSGPFPFSRPSNAVTHWLSDYTNGIAASNATFVPENWIVMRDGTQFGVAIESPQAFGTNASFDNLWYHCS